jgi:hypothetical protein
MHGRWAACITVVHAMPHKCHVQQGMWQPLHISSQNPQIERALVASEFGSAHLDVVEQLNEEWQEAEPHEVAALALHALHHLPQALSLVHDDEWREDEVAKYGTCAGVVIAAALACVRGYWRLHGGQAVVHVDLAVVCSHIEEELQPQGQSTPSRCNGPKVSMKRISNLKATKTSQAAVRTDLVMQAL